MLRFPKHGATVVVDAALSDSHYDGRTCLSEACGYAPTDPKPDVQTESGMFAYLFPDAPEQTGGSKATKALDALGKSMVDLTPSETDNSPIPPVFTYWGQFIDHDVTAAMDVEAGFSDMHGAALDPVYRPDVAWRHRNMRAGSLNLDSLYGHGPMRGSQAKAFSELLRYPHDRAKMWLGTLSTVPGQRVDLPKDPAADLLRLGRVLDKGETGMNAKQLLSMPGPFKDRFTSGGGINRQAAMIGDSRNDENLFVAQFHLAMLRFHNRVVDSAHKHGGPIDDRDKLFDWARERVSWHYQWLVLNQYLPTVCDPSIVSAVIAKGAPLYSKFFADNLPPRDDLLPMPLEFAAAAYRFGHSQIRASYDWNRFFGRPDDDPDSRNRATFDLMFRFTGEARDPTSFELDPMFGAPRLPSNWPANWSRLSGDAPQQFADRSARRIDTRVSLPLADMTNELRPDELVKFREIFKHLMVRNLRRGLKLNIASAQDCIAEINATGHYDPLPELTPDQLLSGRTGKAIKDGGFDTKTPLWFYVLKEAEVMANGNHLGPLGSTIVADTLVGLAVCDRRSYWHQAGSDHGRWHPSDGSKPEGEVVDSIEALLRAALVL